MRWLRLYDYDTDYDVDEYGVICLLLVLVRHDIKSKGICNIGGELILLRALRDFYFISAVYDRGVFILSALLLH